MFSYLLFFSTLGSFATVNALIVARNANKGAEGKETAWGGMILPGAVVDKLSNTSFLPFYVAAGDALVDDPDDSIVYRASPSEHAVWRVEDGNPLAVERTIHSSYLKHANATLYFRGTRLTWFGPQDKRHGRARVYLDSKFHSVVDQHRDGQALSQQPILQLDNLKDAAHTLAIVPTNTDASLTDQWVSIDAFVVASNEEEDVRNQYEPLLTSATREVRRDSLDDWQLTRHGRTGVAAMQISIVSDTTALIIDKVEHNPLTVNGHPAWGALYDLRDDRVYPLDIQSNSFCAGGTWLGNGTLINVGGNPVVADKTGAADFGDVNGLQSIRFFDPCDPRDSSCRLSVKEFPSTVHMASPRWYPSVVRLSDGSAMILGGSLKGGWMNSELTNNPSIEYYPPKDIHGSKGAPIFSRFLADTLNSNLFPIAFALPDDRVFIAANNNAMIYNWRDDIEERLPDLPNGVRVTYPMSGTGVLLPLSPANNYTPEVLICGGSTVDDALPELSISSQDAASDQCSRMVLSKAGIKKGWSVERMPEARIMPDAVLLPDGKVLIVNGGKTGIAGYGNVRDRVGESNAANPAFTPVVYDPQAPVGQRFSRDGMPSSTIARLYHSVATLTPNGTIMIAGSNPNLDRSNVKYGTEYVVEWLYPPYMFKPRPSFSGVPEQIVEKVPFNLTVYGIGVEYFLPIQVSLIDMGFATHGVHMNARMVILEATLLPDMKTVLVKPPADARVYPPGPAWLCVSMDGTPSAVQKTWVFHKPPPSDPLAMSYSATLDKDAPPKFYTVPH